MAELLKVEDLQVKFDTAEGQFAAVDGVSFSVNEGEIVCVVGESGSGKSVTSMSVMRLLQAPPAHYTRGRILYLGEDLLKKTEKQMKEIRGRDIAMIFQEPMTSLNPVLSVGYQITEGLKKHQNMTKAEAHQKAVSLLSLVGITEPEKRLREYPHQMSGGMRQRIMIAIALACSPRLLIADEPTTALDVTIQAQILRLIRDLRTKLNMSVLLITHDLGVVAQMADRVVVMYAGRVMEDGTAADIFENPKHPYTVGLMNCIPGMQGRVDRLTTIEGVVPPISRMPEGCRFATRCPYAEPECMNRVPELHIDGQHTWSCRLTEVPHNE